MGADTDNAGIWLEVAELQFDTVKGTSKVQLKGDRAHPKPAWWDVESTVLGARREPSTTTPATPPTTPPPATATEPDIKAAYETYKAILNEMDKKRVVLARLTWKPGPPVEELHCNALRFQSPDVGSRSS